MKKLVSVFLVATVLLVPLSMSCIGVGAEIPVELVTVVADAPSEFGYIKYNFIDEDGNAKSLNDGITISNKPTYSTSASTLPASYDSRSKNCITAPKDQGETSNCWAFSAISVLETASILQGIDNDELANIDYSEAHLAWFASKPSTSDTADSAYGDGVNSNSPYKTGGNSSIVTAALSRWSGVAEEADYPFYNSDISKMGNYDEADRYDTGSGIVIKSSETLIDSADAKQWIIDYGSVTAPFYYSSTYFNSDTNAYHYSGINTINHEIIIIGWDDNYAVENFKAIKRPSSAGAWLCKATWGEEWGDNGYFWISYETEFDYFNGYTAQSANKYFKNYTYNGAGWNGYIKRTVSASISNIFNCTSHEILSAISTYTLNPNATLNINIYTDLGADYTDPTAGTLAASWTTTIKRAGYHTIELPNEVTLTPGSNYSIVIEFVTDGETIYIPVEANADDGVNVYANRDGETLVYLKSSAGWTSPDTYGINNVCIQAFTKCNHQFEITESIASTCIEEGLEKSTCTQCGEETEKTLPLSDHSFGEWSEYTENEETEKLVRTRSCSVCQHTETEETDPPKGNFFSAIANFFASFFKKIINAIKSIFA